VTFFGGYLKSRVYTNRPQTLQDLKRNIQEETANIPINMLERETAEFGSTGVSTMGGVTYPI
jgi:hypothetical protein